MPGKKRFRVLTPEELVTYDTFVLAEQQPKEVEAGCRLVVHEPSGRLLTVHRTRLIPVEDPGVLSIDHGRKSACAKCGRVDGVAEDEVTCPHLGRVGCGLVEAKV